MTFRHPVYMPMFIQIIYTFNYYPIIKALRASLGRVLYKYYVTSHYKEAEI